jgi:hypothetical protein
MKHFDIAKSSSQVVESFDVCNSKPNSGFKRVRSYTSLEEKDKSAIQLSKEAEGVIDSNQHIQDSNQFCF